MQYNMMWFDHDVIWYYIIQYDNMQYNMMWYDINNGHTINDDRNIFYYDKFDLHNMIVM